MEQKSVSDGTHAFAVRLMQHLVVPTFVLDADRRVLIWNRACERLTGVPASEVVGTQDHWCAFYDAPRYCLADILALDRSDELQTLYASHTEPSESGFGLRAENWCTMPRAGNRLYLAIDAGPIFDDQGNLVAVVETLRDMTEQKLAQTALQNLATRDGLTGIANRRSFDDRLQLEWLRTQREHQPLSLILMDVDFFKRYNDNYGHQQGDECLRQVAAAMAAAVFRPADLVARYGGEEFVVIMPNTNETGALAVAERICERIRELAIAHAYSDVAAHVTVSIGAATLIPQAEQPSSELVSAADAALYAAKHAGRDRVVASRAPEALTEEAS
jgi:diguanylate cyclase (GGDEF)-like protein